MTRGTAKAKQSEVSHSKGYGLHREAKQRRSYAGHSTAEAKQGRVELRQAKARHRPATHSKGIA